MPLNEKTFTSVKERGPQRLAPSNVLASQTFVFIRRSDFHLPLASEKGQTTAVKLSLQRKKKEMPQSSKVMGNSSRTVRISAQEAGRKCGEMQLSEKSQLPPVYKITYKMSHKKERIAQRAIEFPSTPTFSGNPTKTVSQLRNVKHGNCGKPCCNIWLAKVESCLTPSPNSSREVPPNPKK